MEFDQILNILTWVSIGAAALAVVLLIVVRVLNIGKGSKKASAVPPSSGT